MLWSLFKKSQLLIRMHSGCNLPIGSSLITADLQQPGRDYIPTLTFSICRSGRQVEENAAISQADAKTHVQVHPWQSYWNVTSRLKQLSKLWGLATKLSSVSWAQDSCWESIEHVTMETPEYSPTLSELLLSNMNTFNQRYISRVILQTAKRRLSQNRLLKQVLLDLYPCCWEGNCRAPGSNPGPFWTQPLFIISILLFFGLDYLLQLDTPKLHVPTEIKVHL